MTDLSRLSAKERQVLQLLAQGHTAKSIAAEIGATETAVNERLREARRKTGVGSSRELARRLRLAEGPPQESRAEKSGLAPPPAPRQAGPVSSGALLMILGASAAGALIALAMAQAAAPPAGPPRVVATFPAAGAVVAPGEIGLRVTFDRPMRAESYSFVVRDPALYPDCGTRPVQSKDRRSYTLRCRLQPGRRYEIGFNGGRFRNFVGEGDGAPATPAVLRFSTGSR